MQAEPPEEEALEVGHSGDDDDDGFGSGGLQATRGASNGAAEEEEAYFGGWRSSPRSGLQSTRHDVVQL
jgi:hypothetical protein